MVRIVTRFAFGLAFVLASTVHAKQVSGVDVAETISHSQESLKLNGAGTRTKFFVDMYVAALYLSEASSDAAGIIAADDSMAIRLHIVSDLITPERMADFTRDGFVRSTGGNIADIEADIESLVAAFQDAVDQGDIFDLVYQPETGVTVYRNGEAKSTVTGLKFKQALFGIWLSDDPVQKGLRDDLLNG